MQEVKQVLVAVFGIIICVLVLAGGMRLIFGDIETEASREHEIHLAEIKAKQCSCGCMNTNKGEVKQENGK